MSGPESAAVISPVHAGEILDDKYRIDRILGAGGMGVVVVATHLVLDQKVAIKFLLPAVAQNGEAVARFAREARAAASIQSEHVARVIDVAKTRDGAPYIVMEYLEGKDLEKTLEEHQTLPIERVVDYILQALEALSEAHAAGIVHRDLKPANLFLARRADGSSVVKVLDFGISKLVRSKDPQITTTSVQIGSPLYMSPEQLRSSRDVDARSDIWAIGVILHELITASPPFLGDSLPEVITGILTEPPLSMRLRRPDAPAELEQVVLRCLQKEPAERFPDVAQLALALAPFGPARSELSIERVVRVIAGRKEISLAPESAGPAVPGPIPMMAARMPVLSPPVPARATRPASTPGPAASKVTLKSTLTESSWQTSGVPKPARQGRRWVVGGVAAAVVVAVVAAGAVVLTRTSGVSLPPAPAAVLTVPLPAVTASTPTPAAAAPPATTSLATPAPTTAPTPPPPSAPLARPGVARPASTSVPVTSAPTASPAVTATATARSDKPGPLDFGGRK